MTIHWKAVEQYFTVVLFVFNFLNIVVLELALPGVNRLVNRNTSLEKCVANVLSN